MPGPWEKYQAIDSAASQPAADGPWSKYAGADTGAAPDTAKPAAQGGGVFDNIIAGVNDTIARGIGSPVDLANRIMGRVNNAGRAAIDVGKAALGDDVSADLKDIGAHPDLVDHPVGGSEFVKQQMGRIGANPDDVPITSNADHIARAVGAGVLMMAAPEVFAKEAPGLIAGLLRAGRTVPTGAASGAAGEIARESVPEKYQPLAETIGSIAGGGAGALVTEGPKAVSSVARNLAGPMTDSGARTAAASTLANSATDLDAAKAALDKGNYEIVPGSKPTTFQQTGDMGIGSLERQSQTLNPTEFNQRRADQNTARRTALDEIQPGGDPADLSEYVKGRIKWFDQQTQSDIEAATRTAQQRVEAMGGNQHPELYGAKLRQEAQAARDAAKTRESGLWSAIDPDGALTVSSSPISQQAQSIIDGLPKTAKPIGGEEKGILTAAMGLGDTATFQDVAALRSRVNDALHEELTTSGRTQAYARLSRLRGAIENGINGAVEQRAQDAPEELKQGISQFEQEARQFSVDARARRQGAGPNVTGDAGGVPADSGTTGKSGGGPAAPSGNQGVPAQIPNFDDAARDRLNAATAATRTRVDTFDSGAVGDILRNQGRADQYKMPDASVPQRLFRPGPRGAQDVQSYIGAVGQAKAVPDLTDYAAMSLKRYAGKDDGTLDPSKAQTWLSLHRDAVRALPDGVRARFQNAATASDVIAEAMAARKRILDNYQTGAFAKLAGLDNAGDVTRAVGNVLNSGNRVQQMRDLAAAAQRNPDATAGLRKSVADYISQKMVGNTEAATSGQTGIKSDAFQTFIRQNNDALRTVFTADEVANMEAIAADLQRANRSINAVKIPGQSNTAQDLTSSSAGKQSILGKVIADGTREAAAVGTGAAMSLSGFGIPVAVGTWLGVRTLANLRAAGIQRTNDLVRDALLNPEFAKELLREAPTKASSDAGARISRALVRSAAYGFTSSHTAQADSKGLINSQPAP